MIKMRSNTAPPIVPPSIADFEELLSDFEGFRIGEGGGSRGGVGAGKLPVLLSGGATEARGGEVSDGDCAGEGVDSPAVPLKLTIGDSCSSLLRTTTSFWSSFLAKTNGSLVKRDTKKHNATNIKKYKDMVFSSHYDVLCTKEVLMFSIHEN